MEQGTLKFKHNENNLLKALRVDEDEFLGKMRALEKKLGDADNVTQQVEVYYAEYLAGKFDFPQFIASMIVLGKAWGVKQSIGAVMTAVYEQVGIKQ